MEIPAACGTVDIEDFAGEEEAGREFALEGEGIDLFEGDAAGSGHAFVESAGGTNGERAGGQEAGQGSFLGG